MAELLLRVSALHPTEVSIPMRVRPHCLFAIVTATSLCVASVASVAFAQITAPANPADPTPSPASPVAVAVTFTNEPVEGSAVQRGRSETIINAPMDQVVRAMGDFPRYPEFMPRVGEARVIRRNRAVTDIYVQVPLPRSLGVVWSLVRVTTRRSPDRVEMSGDGIDGNMERFETHCLIERIPGTDARTRFTFRILALPRLPLPSSVFTREMAVAARNVATNVRTRVERGYALDGVRVGVSPSTTPGSSPEASTRR